MRPSRLETAFFIFVVTWHAKVYQSVLLLIFFNNNCTSDRTMHLQISVKLESDIERNNKKWPKYHLIYAKRSMYQPPYHICILAVTVVRISCTSSCILKIACEAKRVITGIYFNKQIVLKSQQQQEKQMQQIQLPSHAKWGHSQLTKGKSESLSLIEIQKLEKEQEKTRIKEEV